MANISREPGPLARYQAALSRITLSSCLVPLGKVLRALGMTRGPMVTDPDRYRVSFEKGCGCSNTRTSLVFAPHHTVTTGGVTYTLSSFERRLFGGDRVTDVQLRSGRAVWLTLYPRTRARLRAVADGTARAA